MIFRDRVEAGQQLAERLIAYKRQRNVVVIGLPRGGVIVAYEVAKMLQQPLDIIVARKIGAPGNPEFAIGAITEDSERVLNESIVEEYHISAAYIQEQAYREQAEAQRRLLVYRGKRPPLALRNQTVLLIDDGIATGYTMLAAIISARHKGAQVVVVAAPVAPPATVELVQPKADDTIILYSTPLFSAVGQFYEAFNQVTDEEVVHCLI